MEQDQKVRRSRLHFIVAVLVLQLNPFAAQAQAPEDVQSEFRRWATKSLHPVTTKDLDAPTRDLRPVRNMIRDARIVALSEAVHAGSEPLAFRNRLIKYLVEDVGFTAIVLESGIVESRSLNDYVVEGKGDFDTAFKQGLTWTFDAFRQNADLIHWLRMHNAQLPASARKVKLYGFDVPGSPANTSATRGPQTALVAALEYLDTVDPSAAVALRSRVDTFVPALKRTDPYGKLTQEERDALTASIADLNSLLEHRRYQYTAKSSKEDFEWGLRAAVGARQIDAWLRWMPLDWTTSKGFEWARDASQTRDRAMADNLEWVVGRLDPRERLLVFAAGAHTAASPFRYPDAPDRDMFGFGTYAKAHFGSNWVSILNLVVGGEIASCLTTARTPRPLKPPPDSSIESVFASVNVPNYVLDLRPAPPRISEWLRQTNSHFNGFGEMRYRTAEAFDIVFFASPITPACFPK